MKILAINPGSTSTKIGVYDDVTPILSKTIRHDHEVLQKFATVANQVEFRTKLVDDTLRAAEVSKSDLDACVAIGGLLPPVHAGGYVVCQKMVDYLTYAPPARAHASNLGAIIAYSIATEVGCPAFIYDAVSAGKLPEVAQVTGFPEIKRMSLSHALNSRAQAHEYAAETRRSFYDLNLIIAHLGGGVSLSAYERGNLVDSCGDDFGPFSSERSGSAPLMDFVDFIFDNELTKAQAQKRIRGSGGIMAHLGTASVQDAQAMMESGDDNAALVLEAMCYNTAKGISALAAVLCGKVDAIILTGGIMHSEFVAKNISRRVSFIAKVAIRPGEYELEALVAGCLRILKGVEVARGF